MKIEADSKMCDKDPDCVNNFDENEDSCPPETTTSTTTTTTTTTTTGMATKTTTNTTGTINKSDRIITRFHATQYW